GLDAAFAAALFALGGAALLAASLGASIEEWRQGLAQAGRSAAWAGAWIVFGARRALGFVASLLARTPRAESDDEAPAPRPQMRVAPSLDAGHADEPRVVAPLVAVTTPRPAPAVIAPRVEPQKPKKPVAAPKGRQAALDLPSPDSYQLPSLDLL